MLVKGKDPREIVIALINRSICAVKVGAVIVDRWGIHSWGWNSSGYTGLGEHAEAHAIRRCNRDRMGNSTLYVGAVRMRNNKIITAKPCEECMKLIKGIGRVIYRNGEGEWVDL